VTPRGVGRRDIPNPFQGGDMHRFVLALCLVLAPFDLRVDAVNTRACAHLRALPTTAATWCVRAPTPSPWLRGIAAGIGHSMR